MKKFLCYDTNDAASGKIGVNSNGVLKPNSTVPSTNGAANQQLVTDRDGNVQWEDRLAYDDSKLVLDGGDGLVYIKVADEVPSWASVNTPIKYWWKNDDNTEGNHTLTLEEQMDFGNGSFGASNIAVFITTDNFEFDGFVFPEKGVYFDFTIRHGYISGIANEGSDTPKITWDGNAGEIKKLDKKFIPSELNEVILPSSTSGSTKKFKITVDDSGAISATEV